MKLIKNVREPKFKVADVTKLAAKSYLLNTFETFFFRKEGILVLPSFRFQGKVTLALYCTLVGIAD